MPVLLPAPEQTLASALSLATGGVAEEAVHTSRRSEDVRHGEEFADLVAAAGAADVEHEATRHQKKQRSFHLKDVDVLEELGSGSFGCVFRCRVQDTEYAVKVKHRVCSQGTADKEVAILKHLAQDKPNRFIVQLLAEAVRNDWCGLKHGGPRRKQDAKEAMAAESGLHLAPEEGGAASNADSCACGKFYGFG